MVKITIDRDGALAVGHVGRAVLMCMNKIPKMRKAK